MSGIVLHVSRIDGADPKVPLPDFATPGSAGVDLRANLPEAFRTTGMVIPGGGWRLVPLGLIMEIPPGHEGQIRSRSGLALEFGISVLNSPGTIDSDYRGPVGVILVNHGDRDYMVAHGSRIGQLVVSPVSQPVFRQVENSTQTERGAGGFGSTGVD